MVSDGPGGRPSGISPNHLHWDHLQTGCERHSSHHILLYHSRIIPSAWQPDSLAQTIPFLRAGLGRFWIGPCRLLTSLLANSLLYSETTVSQNLVSWRSWSKIPYVDQRPDHPTLSKWIWYYPGEQSQLRIGLHELDIMMFVVRISLCSSLQRLGSFMIKFKKANNSNTFLEVCLEIFMSCRLFYQWL